ncbi:S16 family serine protease [Boudabousia marimammalium]|uniref:Lon proteolytic domain-containing protein n=1 Tax=Boudabousia marimammalium TaxID=156892 RepID=A0A1Q5PLX1_9ACTO|nr:S16 family serine protease [Boudabousia marimammalium]OKL48065.1 hypothetical protein BM477_06255 [Boudabousia marimammalium]
MDTVSEPAEEQPKAKMPTKKKLLIAFLVAVFGLIVLIPAPARVLNLCENQVLVYPGDAENMVNKIRFEEDKLKHTDGTPVQLAQLPTDSGKLLSVSVFTEGLDGDREISVSSCLRGMFSDGYELVDMPTPEFGTPEDAMPQMQAHTPDEGTAEATSSDEDEPAQAPQDIDDGGYEEGRNTAFALAFESMKIAHQVKIVVVDALEAKTLKAGDELIELRQGDNIINLDSAGKLIQFYENTPAGTEVTVIAKRGSDTITETIATIVGPPDLAGSALPVRFKIDYDFNKLVHYLPNSGIYGSSGSLAIALATMNALDGGSLMGKDSVAVTGDLRPDGVTYPVNGIYSKVYSALSGGADWFLMPEDNCVELKDRELPPEIKLVAVKDVNQAAEVMRAIKSGQTDQLDICPHK